MPIPVIAWIAINVGLYILNYAYRHFTKPDAVRPKPQQFRMPRAEENATIPWFIGRVRVRSPILVDKWGLHNEPVSVDVGGEDVVVGYRYVFDGMRLVLALGTPSGQTFLHRMWFGDREVLNVNGAPTITGSVSKLDFYGGKGQGGGVSFAWYLYPGDFDQLNTSDGRQAVQTSWEAAGRDGDLFTPLRGQVAVALLDFNTGEGASMEPISAEIQYSDPISSSGIHSLDLVEGADANPAVALWYVLTDGWGGLGISESDIDEDSFVTAGTTLATEGNGFSMIDESGGSAQERVDTIIAQIDGVLYQEPTTGKWTLGLIRDDYDIGDLTLFDEANVVGEPEYEAGTWAQLTNQVMVVYEDRAKNYSERTARAQDLASINAQAGRVRSVTIPFPGCKTRQLAAALASRELRKLSLPLATAKLPVNRDGLNVRPGSVIKWSWSEYGVTEMVMRVVKVDPGSLDANTVWLHCVQDRFAYDATVMPEPDWVFPIADTYRIVERWVGEAPRWIQYRGYIAGAINDPDGARGYYLAVPRGLAVVNGALEARNSLDAGTSYTVDVQPKRFPGRATVETAYGRELDPYDTGTGLRIENLSGCTLSGTADGAIILQGRNLALIDNGVAGEEEIIAFGDVTDEGGGVYTLGEVWRGLFDTVPRDHALGERIYFLGSISTAGQAQNVDVGRVGGSARDFEDSVVVSLRTQGDSRHEDEAPWLDTVTIGLRALKPLPVADLEIGASKTPATLTEEGIDLTWKRRDRLAETVVRGDQADVEPEAGTTYLIEGTRGDGLYTNEIQTGINDVEALDVSLASIGYGAIEVSVRSRRTITLPDGTSEALSSHQSPSLVIECPEWRNLLLNPRGAANSEDHWTVTDGLLDAVTPGIGGAGYYLTSDHADNGNLDFYQDVNVAGWWCERMTALLWVMAKNTDGDAIDTLTVDLVAKQANGTTISTQTYGPTAQSTSQWFRRSVTFTALPADTAILRARILATDAGGSDWAAVAVTEMRLMVGQLVSPWADGFESGLGSWTSVSGTFTVPTTAPLYEGAQYARGDAAADSEYRRDYSIAAGYEVGATALLDFARMNDSGNGTGTVTIECRDGSGVLASATTSAENVGTTWVRRQLSVEIPVGTTTIRVRMISTRTLATASACFDDFVLTLHKHLEPDEDDTLDFTTPDPRPLPESRDHWNRQYPDITPPDLGIWTGESLQGRLGSEPTMEASSTAYAGAKFAGCWDPELEQNVVDAIDIPAGRVRTTGNTTYANFRSADRFTCVIAARNLEEGLAAARGLVGRLGTTGWSLSITAAGVAQAKLVGLGGTKTATGTQVIAGGTGGDAPFVVGMSYDGTTLRVCDGNGVVSTATSGMGEIQCNEQVRFTIGRASSAETDFVGSVARVWLWRSGLGTADLEEIVGDLGAALPGGLQTYDRNGAAYYPAESDADGVLVACVAEDRPAWGYTTDGHGLIFSGGVTNQITTWNLLDADWTASGATTGAVDVRSPMGRVGQADSIRITGTSADYFGTQVIPETDDTGSRVITFHARADVAHNITVKFGTDAVGEIDAQVVSVTTTWQRFDIEVTAWDLTTATAYIQFYPSTDGTTRTFDLAAPIGFCNNTGTGNIPYAIPLPGGTTGDASATETTTRSLQFNAEGEIIVEGTCVESAPESVDLIRIDNGTNDNDARELQIGGSAAGDATFRHFNATGTGTASETTAQDWSTPFVARGRWCRAGLLDAASVYAGVVFGDDLAAPQDYDVTSAFTVSAVALDRITIGSYGNSPYNGVIRSVRLTARETRLEP